MIATGIWKGSSPLDIPADLAHSSATFKRLSNYTMSEIEKKLLAYNKLIVVRHPFERLLSAYRNKFEAKNEKSSMYFQSRFGRKIIKVFMFILLQIIFYVAFIKTHVIINLNRSHMKGYFFFAVLWQY
jgi:hypothetical protein